MPRIEDAMKPAGTTIIKAGRLLAGPELTAQSDMAVVVEDGLIREVSPFAELRMQSVSEVIDCSDLWVMPGLIDAHNHLSLDSSLPDYLERMNDPTPALAVRAVKNLREDHLAGVTTVRCLGDKDFIDIECRKAIRAGYLAGPRLVISGKGIRSSAGHGFVGCPFDGPDRIRDAVRANISHGADIIKFYVTGTLPSPGGIKCFFSQEEIAVIVEEAQRMGLKTSVHCIGGVGFDWCLDAGVDVIEHGYFLTAQQIARLKDSDSDLVMTPSFYMSEQRLMALPGPLVAPHLAARPQAEKCMAAIVESGIEFGLGTDGTHGPGNLAAEIACLLKLGCSLKGALLATTRQAAQICGLGDETGSIEVGKSADLIGSTGDPLQGPENLENVAFVMSQGQIIKK